MADQPKLQLNKAGLQDFVDHQIAPFKESVKKVANDDAPEGVPINALLGKGKTPVGQESIYSIQKPITIGLMKTDTTFTHGDVLVAKINEAAESISGVYEQQIKLFGDLHDNLNKTIQKLMDGQHDSLEKIDGKNFLDGLGAVPSDFQGTNGNSNS